MGIEGEVLLFEAIDPIDLVVGAADPFAAEEGIGLGGGSEPAGKDLDAEAEEVTGRDHEFPRYGKVPYLSTDSITNYGMDPRSGVQGGLPMAIQILDRDLFG